MVDSSGGICNSTANIAAVARADPILPLNLSHNLPRISPRYSDGSLVNLIASIVAAAGGAARHGPLAALPPAELSAARNIVLLIIDGLGDNYLRRRGAGGALSEARRCAITSVFPSTTASAITTSYTGCTPLEHGLTGWFCYFGEAGCVGAPLPFTSRGDQLPLTRRGATPTGYSSQRGCLGLSHCNRSS